MLALMPTIRVARPGNPGRGVTLAPFEHPDTPAGRKARAAEVESLAAIEAAIARGERVVVAIGVSGGKDSCAAAIATVEYLRGRGFRGAIVLIHADLGRVEWEDSLRTCERLAAFLGVELLVTRRASGDMMDRWHQRWRDNLRRYTELLCVKVILPWSTPDMRFCTSELKIAPICRELVHRFPGHTIISVAGIRRDESTGRSKAATAKVKAKLASKTRATHGYDWNAIAGWTEADVYALCRARGFEMHEGYTRWNMTRISCVFCIMQNDGDQRAAASNPKHHPLLREMGALELASTFGFQGDSWLVDLRPDFFGPDEIAAAKARGVERERIESAIPDHLLYTDGWPTVMPTAAEAEDLCRVRREIGALLSIPVKYTTPADLLARYAELMAKNAERTAAKARAAERKAARSHKES